MSHEEKKESDHVIEEKDSFGDISDIDNLIIPKTFYKDHKKDFQKLRKLLYGDEGANKCEKETYRGSIEAKIERYLNSEVYHIPIVRNDKYSYNVYIETRANSNMIFSMCFRDMYFFDFDTKLYPHLSSKESREAAIKLLELYNKLIYEKYKFLIVWAFYDTDRGHHAYCVSHKRNIDNDKAFQNIIDDTGLLCTDSDWVAFTRVRFGYCTRLSDKIYWEKTATDKKSPKKIPASPVTIKQESRSSGSDSDYADGRRRRASSPRRSSHSSGTPHPSGTPQASPISNSLQSDIEILRQNLLNDTDSLQSAIEILGQNLQNDTARRLFDDDDEDYANSHPRSRSRSR